MGKHDHDHDHDDRVPKALKRLAEEGDRALEPKFSILAETRTTSILCACGLIVVIAFGLAVAAGTFEWTKQSDCAEVLNYAAHCSRVGSEGCDPREMKRPDQGHWSQPHFDAHAQVIAERAAAFNRWMTSAFVFLGMCVAAVVGAGYVLITLARRRFRPGHVMRSVAYGVCVVTVPLGFALVSAKASPSNTFFLYGSVELALQGTMEACSPWRLATGDDRGRGFGTVRAKVVELLALEQYESSDELENAARSLLQLDEEQPGDRADELDSKRDDWFHRGDIVSFLQHQNSLRDFCLVVFVILGFMLAWPWAIPRGPLAAGENQSRIIETLVRQAIGLKVIAFVGTAMTCAGVLHLNFFYTYARKATPELDLYIDQFGGSSVASIGGLFSFLLIACYLLPAFAVQKRIHHLRATVAATVCDYDDEAACKVLLARHIPTTVFDVARLALLAGPAVLGLIDIAASDLIP